MNEKLGSGIPEPYALRCYDCGEEWVCALTVNDSICEKPCPKCGKSTCEINFGKKPKGNLI